MIREIWLKGWDCNGCMFWNYFEVNVTSGAVGGGHRLISVTSRVELSPQVYIHPPDCL